MIDATCRTCRRSFFYTGSIPIHATLAYIYDFPGLGFFSQDVKDDWVGAFFEGKVYCRQCIRERKVIFMPWDHLREAAEQEV